MEKTKILVCGATGFIGRNIVERLSNRTDFHVTAISHKTPPFDTKSVNWTTADLTLADDVERVVREADVIIQAAATTSGSKDIVTRPYIHTTDNAIMNSLLLRAAFEHDVKHFLFFSCSVMYQPSQLPLKETDFDPGLELVPNYFGVGWSKIYLEKMCEFYTRISKLKCTVFRHSNIFGPHDKYDLDHSHVFGATMTKVMNADYGGEITIWGNGKEGRDLLYISDLLDCVELAIDRQKEDFGLYNVGAGCAITIKDLVLRIIAASKKPLKIKHDLSQPNIPTTLCLDCTRIGRAFGWKPRISLEDGILRTMEWYDTNIGGNTNMKTADPEITNVEIGTKPDRSINTKRNRAKTPTPR